MSLILDFSTRKGVEERRKGREVRGEGSVGQDQARTNEELLYARRVAQF